jgi:hypothetical protein
MQRDIDGLDIRIGGQLGGNEVEGEDERGGSLIDDKIWERGITPDESHDAMARDKNGVW